MGMHITFACTYVCTLVLGMHVTIVNGHKPEEDYPSYVKLCLITQIDCMGRFHENSFSLALLTQKAMC